MTKYSRDEILSRVEELGMVQSWNHSIELPYNIKTTQDKQVSHGKNLVKWSRIEPYLHAIGIKGKRVLDIGCNEGFFSLKLKELGAKEVVGIDADKLRIEKARFVSELLDISGICFEVGDIFDKGVEEYGHFDFALCMGFLHRVPSPYYAIRQLTKMSDIILFEWKCLQEGNYDLPIMKFCGGESKDSNIYSGLYWLPSVSCMVEILKSLGFAHNFVIDNSKWRRAIVISSHSDNPVFQSKNVIGLSKFSLLKKVSGSYLRSILRIFGSKK
jgi:SAM-dependent methyltransferase